MNSLKVNFENDIEPLKKALIEEINKSDKVFIIPHKNMDFDALASAAALYAIAKLYRKEVYIVTDDEEKDMNSSFKIIYKTLKQKCTFISTQELEDWIESKY